MTKLWIHIILARLAVIIVALFIVSGGVRGQVPFIQAPAFDAAWVEADDLEQAEAGNLPLYGRMLPIMAETELDGVWSDEGNERVWRLGISSPGALAMECFLDRMEVPEGATLSILLPDGSAMAKAVPIELPVQVHEFSTAMVAGDACIIEYREPITTAGRGSFRVAQVSHAYRDVEDLTAREGSCHVNVACEPESIGWEGPIRATVRISVVTPQGTGWCTGTLVNNIREDCSPYILTAWHCGRTSTTAQFNQYKFYFNFQYANCNGGAYSTAQYLTGSQLKAYSDDYDPQYAGVGGSDFMLLRLNVPVPEAFEPYWAGWDARNIATVTADGVCIHHPTGAPKRISSFTQTVTTGHPMTSSGLQTHYRVKWAPTQNGFGVTEVGSSGSGLFSPNSSLGPLLIGTLTGSSSGMTCTNNSGTSYFGKTSYHWTNNPNTQAQKLKAWLDPDGTGALMQGGSADPCGTASAIPEFITGQTLSLCPNPASEQLVVRAAAGTAMNYQVLDNTGKLVLDGSMIEGHATIDLSALSNGYYLLRTISSDHMPASTPFIISH
ncbi:MAG: T9SS type A sorting domain-containing protein [Flavobacteriales bacterium]